MDVVLTTGPRETATKGLNVLGVEDGVTFARDPGTSRLVLIVSSANTSDLDHDVETFASKASGLVVPTRAGEAIIDGETQKSFSELGFKPEGLPDGITPHRSISCCRATSTRRITTRRAC